MLFLIISVHRQSHQMYKFPITVGLMAIYFSEYIYLRIVDAFVVKFANKYFFESLN